MNKYILVALCAVVALGLIVGLQQVSKDDVTTNGFNATSTEEKEDSGATTRAPIGEQKKSQNTGFKQCGINMTWGCSEVDQAGRQDDKTTTPVVCGCGPISCAAGEHVQVNADTGNWPDGSAKGVFFCTDSWPSSGSTN